MTFIGFNLGLSLGSADSHWETKFSFIPTAVSQLSEYPMQMRAGAGFKSERGHVSSQHGNQESVKPSTIAFA